MSDPTRAAAPQQAGQVVETTSLLDQIVEQGRIAPDARERGKGLVKEFINQVLQGEMTVSRDAEAMINARIAQIDHLISIQLNEIMHHASFQKLEGTWRGLKYLLDQSETSTQLKIKVLNVSKRELLRDLQRAPEFDQSALFKKVYEEEFGIFGGSPFGTLVGDYYFGKGPEDLELLERISQVAASAHAPFISAAEPNFFNLENYTQLDAPRDLAKVFDTTEYAKWKGFRQSEDSRYVGLTCPRILMRVPYGKATKPVDGFNYEEGVDGTDHAKYLWGNASYALAARMTSAFALHGWLRGDPRRRGRRPGQRPPRSQLLYRRRRRGDEVPDRSAYHRSPGRRNWADQGFVPLVHCKDTDYAAFLQYPVLSETQDLRQGSGQRQRAPVRPVAVHHGRFAVRPLSEGDDARQDR